MAQKDTRYDVEAVGQFWAKMKIASDDLATAVSRNLIKWTAADEACENAQFVAQAHSILERCKELTDAIQETVTEGTRLHQQASAELQEAANMNLNLD